MQPDPYNDSNNNYGGGNWGYNQPAPSPIQPLIDGIRANLKTIILLLVVIVAAYYAYDYFVGSQVNVRIEVKDLTGKPVQTISSAAIFQNGELVPKSNFTGPTKSITLRKGAYQVRVSADGFEDNEETIDVSHELSSFTINLVKQTNVELLELSGAPTQIFAGQEVESVIKLENKGATENVNVVATVSPANVSGFEVTVNPSSVVVASGQQEITLTVKASEGMTITEKTGKELTVTIGIEGTTQKESFKMTVFKSANIAISPREFTISRANAGQATAISKITFKNNDTIDYSDFSPEITFDIVNSNNEAESIKQWIKVIDTPSGLLAKKQSKVFSFILDVPSDAVDDQVAGKITFTTPYWSQSIPMTIKVFEAKNLAVFSVSPDNYSVKIDKDTGKYELKPGIIRIQNTTNFNFENLSIKTKDATNCNTNYIKYTGETSYATLSNASTTNVIEIPITVSAPLAAAKDIAKSCVIQLTYDDPLSTTNQSVSIDRLVTITPTS